MSNPRGGHRLIRGFQRRPVLANVFDTQAASPARSRM
jgi:hypothetical protein